MKKILVGLIFIVGSISMTMAQEKHQVRVDMDRKMVKEQVESGNLEFFFNKEVDAGEVRRNAQYYISYFDVVYYPETGKAEIRFKDKSRMSVKVVERFLTSNHISEVLLGKEILRSTDFVNWLIN